MFNFKKAKSLSPQEQMLEENREGKSLNGEIGSTEWMIEKNRKGSESVTIEGSLNSSRSKDANVRVTEGQLEKHIPSEGLPKRDNTNDKAQMSPLAALNAAQENERIAQYEDAGNVKGDTKFWDKFVGTQLLGEELKSPSQISSSQLQNSLERLVGLKVEDMGKQENVKKMVMASMKDADAILFYVYHKASSESRELTTDEKVIVDGITADKIKLASLL